MTLCMLVQPYGHTILFSDCLVTEKVGDEVAPARRPEHSRANFGAPLPPNSKLVRKTIFLKGGPAIAFAGSVSRIDAVISDILEKWKDTPVVERSIDYQRALFHPDNFSNRGVSAVGVITDGNRYFPFGANGLSTVTKSFGQIIAIGSGSEEAVEQSRKWDGLLPDVPPNALDMSTSHALAEFVGALRNRKLFLEDVFDSDPSWGGYLEVFIQDVGDNIWHSTSDWVHLHCFSDGSFFLPTYPYFIYKDGHDQGQLLLRIDRQVISYWEIQIGEASLAPTVGRYYGPFGPNAKITVTFEHPISGICTHVTSFYIDDARFPIDEPDTIQNLDKFSWLFDMLWTKSQRGKEK